MYSAHDIVRGIKDPRRIGRELNRLYHTRGRTQRFNSKGISVIDEDWDNLIILDACRYDAFSEHADLPGRSEYRWSRGAATYEFIRANFQDRTLYDTVYLGANIWFLKLKSEINSGIYKFVDLQNGDYDVEWADEKLQVVTPETVTNHAKRIADSHPNKRHIIHYLQPHHPFLGPTGRENFTLQSSSLAEVIDEAKPEVSKQMVWKAYIENLEQVLTEVQDLIPTLEGKTVITADHGEMLGDRHDFIPMRDYGHHEGIYNTPTVKVPWHIIEADERKEIIEETPVENDPTNQEVIDERLRNLGYKV